MNEINRFTALLVTYHMCRTAKAARTTLLAQPVRLHRLAVNCNKHVPTHPSRALPWQHAGHTVPLLQLFIACAHYLRC